MYNRAINATALEKEMLRVLREVLLNKPDLMDALRRAAEHHAGKHIPAYDRPQIEKQLMKKQRQIAAALENLTGDEALDRPIDMKLTEYRAEAARLKAAMRSTPAPAAPVDIDAAVAHLAEQLADFASNLDGDDDHRRDVRTARSPAGGRPAAAEHRRGAAQRFAEAEEQRREALTRDVDCWQQAAAIRNYLAAMRQALVAGTARPNNEAAFAERFEWATWYADHVDPLVRAKIGPQTVQPPTNKRIGDLDLTSLIRPIVVALGVTDADALHKVTEKQIAGIEKQYSSECHSDNPQLRAAAAFTILAR
ncbi:MAG TPA: hypothetical protein VGR35_05030 [Tepidisphaeraceae bacterium]|nr:hypothetical protein [Tepidisphaeraceae bacterium]